MRKLNPSFVIRLMVGAGLVLSSSAFALKTCLMFPNWKTNGQPTYLEGTIDLSDPTEDAATVFAYLEMSEQRSLKRYMKRLEESPSERSAFVLARLKKIYLETEVEGPHIKFSFRDPLVKKLKAIAPLGQKPFFTFRETIALDEDEEHTISVDVPVELGFPDRESAVDLSLELVSGEVTIDIPFLPFSYGRRGDNKTAVQRFEDLNGFYHGPIEQLHVQDRRPLRRAGKYLLAYTTKKEERIFLPVYVRAIGRKHAIVSVAFGDRLGLNSFRYLVNQKAIVETSEADFARARAHFLANSGRAAALERAFQNLQQPVLTPEEAGRELAGAFDCQVEMMEPAEDN